MNLPYFLKVEDEILFSGNGREIELLIENSGGVNYNLKTVYNSISCLGITQFTGKYYENLKANVIIRTNI